MKIYVKIKDDVNLNDFTNGKLYEVINRFETTTCKSGECVVIISDSNKMEVVDISFFE